MNPACNEKKGHCNLKFQCGIVTGVKAGVAANQSRWFGRVNQLSSVLSSSEWGAS